MNCDPNCPGCARCQHSTTGNSINILKDFNQYIPKHPSALVTIGSVLKALIENGILAYSVLPNGEEQLNITQLGELFFKAKLTLPNVVNDPELSKIYSSQLNLKLEVEV